MDESRDDLKEHSQEPFNDETTPLEQPEPNTPSSIVPTLPRRKTVRISRDYNTGDICTFSLNFPEILEKKATPEQLRYTVTHINLMLQQSDELNIHNACDCFLSCITLFLLPLCVPTFYSKMQKRIEEFIKNQNDTVYVEKGIVFKNPFEVGLLFVSADYIFLYYNPTNPHKCNSWNVKLWNKCIVCRIIKQATAPNSSFEEDIGCKNMLTTTLQARHSLSQAIRAQENELFKLMQEFLLTGEVEKASLILRLFLFLKTPGGNRNGDVRSIIHKFGMSILSHGDNFEEVSLNFLDKLHSQENNANKSIILLEKVLFQVKFKKYDEAFSTLEDNLGNPLISKVPVFRAFSALIAYRKWKVTEDATKKATAGRKAATEFELYFQVGYTSDFLLLCYVEFVMESHDERNETVKNAISHVYKFVEKNPGNPNGYRYLFHLLYHYQPEELEWTGHILDFIKLDPCCDRETYFKPLLNRCLQDGPDCNLVLQVTAAILNSLDFLPSDRLLWEYLNQLTSFLKKPPEFFEEEDVWKGAKEWWLEFHYFRNAEACFEDLKEPTLSSLKKNCAKFLLFQDEIEGSPIF